MSDYTDQWVKERVKTQNKKTKTERKPVQPTSEITGVEFILIGTIAIANDLCDWIGLDLILFRLVDLATAAVLGLWCLIRLHKFPSARFGGTFIVELIPGLGDLSPTWTLFIISVYAEQKGFLPKWLSKLTKGKISK